MTTDSDYDYWLQCDASPGQFSSEYAVSFEDSEGNRDSLFADKRYVHNDDTGQSWLAVERLAGLGALASVSLPNRPFGSGRPYVTVRESQIKERA